MFTNNSALFWFLFLHSVGASWSMFNARCFMLLNLHRFMYFSAFDSYLRSFIVGFISLSIFYSRRAMFCTIFRRIENQSGILCCCRQSKCSFAFQAHFWRWSKVLRCFFVVFSVLRKEWRFKLIILQSMHYTVLAVCWQLKFLPNE